MFIQRLLLSLTAVSSPSVRWKRLTTSKDRQLVYYNTTGNEKVHGFRREKFLARRVTIRMACFFFNPCHTTLFSAPSRRENLSLYPLVDTDPANSATTTTTTTTTDIPASLPLSVPFIPLNIIPRTSTCIPFQSRQEKRRVRLTRRFECLPRLSLASSGRGSLIYLDRESPPEGR